MEKTLSNYFTKNSISHKGKLYTGILPQEVVDAIGSQIDRFIKNGSIFKLEKTVTELNLKTVTSNPEVPVKPHAPDGGETSKAIIDNPLPDESAKAPALVAPVGPNSFKSLRERVILVAKENNVPEEISSQVIKSIKSCKEFLDSYGIIY